MTYSDMKLQDLGKAKADAEEKCRAIIAGAKAAGRELTDDEETQTDTLLTQAEEIAGVIKKRNAQATKLAKLDSLSTGDTSTRSSFAPAASIEVGEPRWKSDPNHGFASAVDYFKAVADAGLGRANAETLERLSTAGSDELSGSNDAYGGFLIPRGVMAGLMGLTPEEDPIGAAVTNIPMTSPAIDVQALTDKDHTSSVAAGVQVYRTSETTTGTASRPKLEQVSFRAHELIGVGFATNQLIQDSPISVAALFQQQFTRAYTSRLINERLRGTGVGQFEGVLNAPSLVSVTKETGQAAATFTYENAVNMYARQYNKGRAIWLMNHDVFPALAKMNQTVGTAGVPAWIPSAREGVPNTLFGRPVYFSEYPSALGTVGDVLFCDWAEYYEATRQGLTSAESVHVRFLENENCFRVTARNDGRTLWRSALTPFKGSNTLSPFVALATRS